MPHNPGTGKTDRRAKSDAELLNLRPKQAGGSGTEVKKGKLRAQIFPGGDEPEDSGPAPSPLTSLVALGNLTLDSGESSPASTPADSPSTFPQPPLPERPAPAPPPVPKTQDASKPSASKFAFQPLSAAPAQHLTAIVEAAAASQPPKRARRKPGRPRLEPSPASGEGSNADGIADRIAALEKRQDGLEKRVNDLDSRLKELGR